MKSWELLSISLRQTDLKALANRQEADVIMSMPLAYCLLKHYPALPPDLLLYLFCKLCL